VLEVLNRPQEGRHLFDGKDLRKNAGSFLIGDLLYIPVSLQGDAVKEAQRSDDLVETAKGDLLNLGEVDLILPDVTQGEQVCPTVEETNKLMDTMKIGAPGMFAIAPELKILIHAIAELAHGRLLANKNEPSKDGTVEEYRE
jgi:hypothetical protein